MDCEMKRHLSPKTVGSILRSLPLEGNAHFFGQNVVYFETAISSGVERQRKEFKQGEVAFLPAGGCICLFLTDAASPKPMTPIGKILSDVSILKDVKPGDIIAIYLADKSNGH
jgi:hypothetical protein